MPSCIYIVTCAACCSRCSTNRSPMKREDAELKKIIADIIAENKRRNDAMFSTFNPVTGEGSTFRDKRVKVTIKDFPLKDQWLLPETLEFKLVQDLIAAGSIKAFYKKEFPDGHYCDSEKFKIIDEFVRIRHLTDFPFWAATLVYIKQKGGGEDILFWLNYPQRILVERFETLRLAGKPIRKVLLKARQWGGSTCTQQYMAWLQLEHKVGLNSLIVAHQGTASDEIEDMFKRMIAAYPVEYLHELGDKYSSKEPKFVGVGHAGNIHRVPQRNCKIKLGTAERPDSARGGDYNLVHCSEVGLWKKTEGKTPSQIVKAATSGIPLKPFTMIVYESTANGTGNFFAVEYADAKAGKSQFEALFIAWFQIELYWLEITGQTIAEFAQWLYVNRENRNTSSNREECGAYLWWLWKQGASLEGIFWYIQERAKYTDHGEMASEYPSDDVEAFVHSGNMVFDKYQVEALKPSCKKPKYVGDVYGKDIEGEDALVDVKFKEDHQGQFWVWELPEIDPDEEVTDRYLVTVDIGGTSRKSDWSVICVIDRLFQMEGGKPVVVAQWYGHIDMDLLAWKSAMIASFYDNALLVIESNTLETHDKNRKVDGDQAGYILNLIKDVYPNLYARKQSDEDIKNHAPVKYGYHTNVATKPKIISNLKKVIREGLYVERDMRCIDEYLTYEQRQDNSYGAIIGKHDDLLMSRGIGLLIAFTEMDIPEVISRNNPAMHLDQRESVSAATIV